MPPQKKEGPRVNEEIRSEKVRLIDENGEMVGVVSVEEAVEKSRKAGFDLVEVSPNADPPVCKILDYGKYKYEQQKKAAAARKKQKSMHVKEIKLRPTIEDHDYEVKSRNARKFLEDGNKVKVSMRFRGREIAHQNVGMEVVEKFRDDLSDISKTDFGPKLEGRQVIMVLSPEKT